MPAETDSDISAEKPITNYSDVGGQNKQEHHEHGNGALLKQQTRQLAIR